MSPYIVNLTDHLITKNRYDGFYEGLGPVRSMRKFIQYVELDLHIGDLSDMKPETLGKIMGSLHSGDVVANWEEISEGIGFNGDCGDLLLRVTARCLAFVIRDRISGDSPDIPKWNRKYK